MSGDTFTGLKPVAKRMIGNDLNRKTKRIVIPSSTANAPADMPLVDPPRIIPQPKAVVVKKRFALMPIAPTLLEQLPQGISLTPTWTFMGSNPLLEMPVYTSVTLQLEGISKIHAAVMEFNGTPFVSDLGSTNGTRILRDQKAIDVSDEPTELLPGDLLWMGSAFFQVAQV